MSVPDLWEVGPKGSNLPVPHWQMSHPFGGSNASRVNTSVRGDVVDLSPRGADIHQLHVAQVGQGGAQFLALAALLKGIQMKLATCRVDPDVRSSHVVPCVVLIAVSPGTVFFPPARGCREIGGHA
jgi:hypothetical protein